MKMTERAGDGRFSWVVLACAIWLGLAPSGCRRKDAVPAHPGTHSGQAHGDLWRERVAAERPPSASAGPGQTLPSIAGLVKRLTPAVVNIFTTQIARPQAEAQEGGSLWDEMFDGRPRSNPQDFSRQSLGSGFILTADGYVLTNHHVVADAEQIRIQEADETTLEAKVVGSDPKTDVALLKVEAKKPLPFVALGDSTALEVGDWVIAIGNPFGLGHTVTAGILSGKDRQIFHGPYENFLQTDASINPGNSGGPLFDASGNVVGMNTAMVAGASGVGFAVPINLIKDLLPQLRSRGKVVRAWLGVGIQDLTEELSVELGQRARQGVLVGQVYAGSPAEKGGLEVGDIILSLNGQPVRKARDLTQRIGVSPPGQKVAIEVLRNGKKRTQHISLDEQDSGDTVAADEGPRDVRHALGLKLSPITPSLASELGVRAGIGLLVDEVEPDSPAADVLEAGDILLEVNKKPTNTVKGFLRALAEKPGKANVLLRILREYDSFYVVVRR